MNRFRFICALLLAIPLTVFGANFFFNVIPIPAGDNSAGTRLLEAMRNGGLMAPIAFSHVLIGIMLVIPRTRFLAALLQLPITIGMTAFHFTMLPAGNVFALVLLALNLGVLADLKRLKKLL